MDRRRAQHLLRQEQPRPARAHHGASRPRRPHRLQPITHERLATPLQESRGRTRRPPIPADWDALDELANALVERSHNHYRGWGDIVRFAACTAARIGEVSGVHVKDINRFDWTWYLCRQTTTGPGGLIDKGTKGKRRRTVPIIEEIRDLVNWRMTVVGNDPMARLFTGPRGGRITTAILRDATHWDEVVVSLGYEYLRRHDLRHTGLTWFADASVPIHVLQKIAGHGHITTTQQYLHPDKSSIQNAGRTLSRHLSADRTTSQTAAPAQAAATEAPARHLRLVQ
ncbi:tyrosine-type recombinase/integrase [Kitasatospora sp. NPDC057940]|uniref:tyrosine-type recombinase/integrase n=1 Tax=Kitasatospora sp. NPDC057940 TaxID=3346285 RepID=UPI0036DE3BC7